MKYLLAFACVGLMSLAAVRPASAQDLAVTNVRIVSGAGQPIERGTIVVRGGRIASVAAGNTAAPGVKVVDGNGLTAVAGFIDGHRHIVTGNDAAAWLKNDAPARMKEFLGAGYTTLVSGGGAAEPVVELKNLIDSGKIRGRESSRRRRCR